MTTYTLVIYLQDVFSNYSIICSHCIQIEGSDGATMSSHERQHTGAGQSHAQPLRQSEESAAFNSWRKIALLLSLAAAAFVVVGTFLLSPSNTHQAAEVQTVPTPNSSLKAVASPQQGNHPVNLSPAGAKTEAIKEVERQTGLTCRDSYVVEHQSNPGYGAFSEAQPKTSEEFVATANSIPGYQEHLMQTSGASREELSNPDNWVTCYAAKGNQAVDMSYVQNVAQIQDASSVQQAKGVVVPQGSEFAVHKNTGTIVRADCMNPVQHIEPEPTKQPSVFEPVKPAPKIEQPKQLQVCDSETGAIVTISERDYNVNRHRDTHDNACKPVPPSSPSPTPTPSSPPQPSTPPVTPPTSPSPTPTPSVTPPSSPSPSPTPSVTPPPSETPTPSPTPSTSTPPVPTPTPSESLTPKDGKNDRIRNEGINPAPAPNPAQAETTPPAEPTNPAKPEVTPGSAITVDPAKPSEQVVAPEATPNAPTRTEETKQAQVPTAKEPVKDTSGKTIVDKNQPIVGDDQHPTEGIIEDPTLNTSAAFSPARVPTSPQDARPVDTKKTGTEDRACNCAPPVAAEPSPAPVQTPVSTPTVPITPNPHKETVTTQPSPASPREVEASAAAVNTATVSPGNAETAPPNSE